MIMNLLNKPSWDLRSRAEGKPRLKSRTINWCSFSVALNKGSSMYMFMGSAIINNWKVR